MRKSFVILLIILASLLGGMLAAGVSFLMSRYMSSLQLNGPANNNQLPGFRNGNRNQMPMMPGFRQWGDNQDTPRMPRHGWNRQQNPQLPATPPGNGGTSTATPAPNIVPRGMGPGGMMNPGGRSGQVTGTRISMDDAVQAAQNYVQQQGGNLKLAEVMEFENNFYAAVQEKDTGRGAFELLVDPYSAAVVSEPGPNMMWNTKYSPMGSAGGGSQEISQDAAKSAAQKFLETSVPGAQIDGDGIAFYGYTTFDYQLNGKIAGMISVNSATAEVWLHTWHGAFLAEKTLQ